MYHVIPEQATWVRQIYDRYASGISTRQIKFWLLERGVRSPEGKAEWCVSTITRILAHPVYKGQPVFGRTQRKVDENRLQQGHKRTDYTRARDESEWVQLQCEPLVSTEIWEVCQQRLQHNKIVYSGNPKRKYLLAGLMICPVCHRRLGGSYSGTMRYYVCPYDRKCAWKRCTAEQAETAVTLAVYEICHAPELTAAAMRAYHRLHNATFDPAEEARIVVEVAQLDRQEKATAQAQVEALVQGRDTAVYDTLLAEIGAKRSILRASLDKRNLQKAQASALEPKSVAEQAALAVAAVKEVLSDPLLTPAEKNKIVSQVVEEVHPDPECKDRFRILLRGSYGTSETVSHILIRVTFDMGDFLSVQAVEWTDVSNAV